MNDLNHKRNSDSKYFRLFPDVIHCKGAVSSALHVLSSSRVFWLDPEKTQALSLLEGNTRLVDVISEFQGSLENIKEFINFLVDVGAGTFYKHPPFVEKVRRPDLTETRSWFKSLPKIRLFHIAPSSTCQMDCDFCTPDASVQRFHPCLGCWRGQSSSELYLPIDHALKAMRECTEYGCHKLRLHLGSSQHLDEWLLVLLSECIGLELASIELFTGSALSSTLLNGVVQYGAMPVFQLFGADPDTHDTICRVAGSFSAIQENIDALRSKGCSYAIVYLHHGQKANPYETLKALSSLKPANLYVDRIGTDDHHARFLTGSEALVPPSMENYVSMLSHSSCKSGRLFLNWEGNYYSCPALPQRSLGNVTKNTVGDLFGNTSLTEYWDGQMGEEICKGCELRYSCRVCELRRRPSEMCGYDPAFGCWKVGGGDGASNGNF